MSLEGITHEPTSSAFINKYELGNPATVRRSLLSLEDKEMIYHTINDSGDKQYHVYDVLLRRWMEGRMGFLK